MARNRAEKGGLALFLFLWGLVVILAAGIFSIMYPSQTSVSLGIAAAGLICAVVAFMLDAPTVKGIVVNRKALLWVNDILLVFAIIGIGVLLSYIATRRHIRYDLTRDQLFSISDSTIKALGNVKKDVKFTCFYANGSMDGGLVEDLLKQYRSRTDKVSYRMVDPFRDPLTAKAMNIRQPGTVVVQCENNRKDIMPDEIFQQAFRYNPGEKPKFQGEQAFTSAIVNVTSGAKRKIMFVTGHDEPRFSQYNQQGLAGVQQFLVKENYDVTEGTLMERVATDVAVVAIISPKKEFHATERKNLEEFVARKGNLLVAFDPDNKAMELESFIVQQYGVVANAEIVINPRGINNDPSIVVPEYTMHPIVKDQIEKKSGVLMQVCRGLSYERKDAWNVSAFLKTSDIVYAKRNQNDVMAGRIEFAPGTDVRGPLNLGLALEGTNQATGTRAVILGDADFASNMLLQVQGNSDLIINTVNWLAGQEQMISIRPKAMDFAAITMDAEAANRVFMLCVIVMPLLVCMVGGAVWMTRRRV